MQELSIKLKSERNLEVFLGEGTSKHAVILHHGGGTSGYVAKLEMDFLSSIGIRAISFSRAGYSSSTRDPGRSVINVLQDISQLLDFLEIESFSSIGHSAGGSHALATGLEPRCRAVVTLASNAEFGHPDFDYFAGVDPENVAGYKQAILDPEKFEADLIEELRGFQATPEAVKNRAPRFFSKKDIELRQNPEYAQIVAEAVNRGIAYGVGGRADDIFALAKRWGFEVSTLSVPVLIVHGQEDLVVPLSHAHWIHAQLPNSSLMISNVHGHFGLFDWARKEIVDLVSG